MSTQPIYAAAAAVARRRVATAGRLAHLDIGAGQGRLIRLLRAQLPVDSSACDFHTERFSLDDTPIERLDLNRAPLPYPEASFDLVTCSEVLEHLENYRACCARCTACCAAPAASPSSRRRTSSTPPRGCATW